MESAVSETRANVLSVAVGVCKYMIDLFATYLMTFILFRLFGEKVLPDQLENRIS